MAITNNLPSVFCWVSQMASSPISSYIIASAIQESVQSLLAVRSQGWARICLGEILAPKRYAHAISEGYSKGGPPYQAGRIDIRRHQKRSMRLYISLLRQGLVRCTDEKIFLTSS